MRDEKKLREELEEVKGMPNVMIEFPNEEDITNFIVALKVNEGLYGNHWFHFSFSIPEEWPRSPPIVRIKDRIWHPNIECIQDSNAQGRIDVSTLSIHRPFFLIYEIIVSLQFVLINPNPNDALNVNAAHEYIQNYESFKAHVNSYLEEMNDDDDDDDDNEDKNHNKILS